MEAKGRELLLGKVVRLHNKTENNKVKLYMVTDDEYDQFSQGRVTVDTVVNWSKSGIKVTVYKEQYNNGNQ